MRDLNDIVESNTRATLDAIPREVAAGNHVVERFTGVNFAGYDVYPDASKAIIAAAAYRIAAPGNAAKVHHPVATTV